MNESNVQKRLVNFELSNEKKLKLNRDEARELQSIFMQQKMSLQRAEERVEIIYIKMVKMLIDALKQQGEN